MNYLEFQEEIRSTIENIMEDKYEVSIQNVMKNNDVWLTAILIREKNTHGAVPTIYLEDYYEMYTAGIEISDIVNSILALYHKQMGRVNITFEDFDDFSKVKDKVMFKLVNYERNISGLEKIPYIKTLDLAMVFYILWENEIGQQLSSVVRDVHMEMWDVSIDELYEAAYENTLGKLSVSVRNMKDVICDIYMNMKRDGENSPEIEQQYLEELNEKEYPMYVVSNKARFLGAATILYKQVLNYLYEKLEGEFYILPSSIHEVIAVSNVELSEDELKKMVTEINENEVDYLEVLSDSVYRYNGEQLVMV